MIRYMDDYFKAAQDQLARITRTQRTQMDTAADWVRATLMQDRFLYAFGSGHSHVLAEEVFYRAGGLARVVPILDENLMVHVSASTSTEWERKEGYAKEVLSRYPMVSGDLLFIISNSGRNPVPVEMALEAKARGARVIAISSCDYVATVTSRHSSGKKLTEIADVVIDNCGRAGDATVQIEGLPQRIGPTSTISSAFILHAIFVEAAARVVAAGGKPEVWGSANSDSTNNDAIMSRYKGKIPHL
ncbi:MAG: SIS domain-containing protein [Limisphaerales bacterium]